MGRHLSHAAQAEALKLVLACGATIVLTTAAFWLYRATGAFLSPVLGPLSMPSGALAWAAAAVPVVAFTAIVILYAFLPVLPHSGRGRAFHVHALHGFYFGALADRWVERFWGTLATKERHHA